MNKHIHDYFRVWERKKKGLKWSISLFAFGKSRRLISRLDWEKNKLDSPDQLLFYSSSKTDSHLEGQISDCLFGNHFDVLQCSEPWDANFQFILYANCYRVGSVINLKYAGDLSHTAKSEPEEMKKSQISKHIMSNSVFSIYIVSKIKLSNVMGSQTSILFSVNLFFCKSRCKAWRYCQGSWVCLMLDLTKWVVLSYSKSRIYNC